MPTASLTSRLTAPFRALLALAGLVVATGASAAPPLDPKGKDWDTQASMAIDYAWSQMQDAPHVAIEVADAVIAGYAQRYPQGRTRWYSASSEAEAARYRSIDAVARDPAYDRAEAMVNVWGEAYHVKAYALVEQALAEHDPKTVKAASNLPTLDPALAARAMQTLAEGLVLQPYHVRMRNELGYLEQSLGQSQQALETFRMAELAAQDPKDDEARANLTRAMRGVGFALIELDRLDEAEAKYREVLRIDPDDDKAKHELRYIEDVRGERGD